MYMAASSLFREHSRGSEYGIMGAAEERADGEACIFVGLQRGKGRPGFVPRMEATNSYMRKQWLHAWLMEHKQQVSRGESLAGVLGFGWDTYPLGD